MWQEIAIILIGLATVAYIGYRLYRSLSTPKDTGNPCCGCTGCGVKELKKQKKCNPALRK